MCGEIITSGALCDPEPAVFPFWRVSHLNIEELNFLKLKSNFKVNN